MTTLAAMALRVANVVTDVLRSQATAGDGTSLTDTVALTQPNQFWKGGPLWILSGDHSGKVFTVDGFSSQKITIAPTVNPVFSTVQYAVARKIYPWMELAKGINSALSECTIIADDQTLLGDGITLTFTLPTGVEQVAYVEVEDPSTHERTRKNHCRQIGNAIKFDYGHSPYDGEIIHLMHKTVHPGIYIYSDVIDPQVNLEWLRWKSAEYVLYWGVQVYGDAKEYRIEELLNRAMTRSKGIMPVQPFVSVRSAG